MPSSWYPGDLAVGSKVFSEPVVHAGLAVFQKGQYSIPPGVTTPGTVATGGTVSNSLGLDVIVYASATTGIQSAKVGTVSIPGSVNSGNTADYFVPGNSSITLTYSGTLSWTWLAT
jgi:hypothetical protein